MFSAVKSAFLLLAATQHTVASGARIRASTNAFEQVELQRQPEGEDRLIAEDPWIFPEEKSNAMNLANSSWTHRVIVNRFIDQKFDHISDGCHHWTPLFWPQVSFLSQEVHRRVQVLPDAVSPAQQAELRAFAKKTSFLMCADVMDARKGTEFSQPVMQYWEQLAAAPASSLSMPELNESAFFRAHKEQIVALGACMEWSQAMMCDLGYNTENFSGKMHSSAKCWNTVQRPPFYKSPSDVYAFNWTSEVDAYLACQEHPLTHEFFQALCPYHGHHPNDGQVYWGQAPPAGSVEYEDIMKCNHKFGIPDLAYPSESFIPEGPDGKWFNTWEHVGFF